MSGIRQISQSIARGPGTLALECHPDPLPSGFNITHRWEPYAANAEPTDPGGAGLVTYLQDLEGSADMVPNTLGVTGASGAQLHIIENQVALGLGPNRRLMTALNRSQPHTLVTAVRPRGEGYTAIAALFGAATTAGARGSVYITADGQWAMNAGSTLLNAAPVRGGKWQIITAVFNGPDSALRIDGAETVGNAGTEVADRLILGSYATLSAPMAAYMGPVYYSPTAWSPVQRANFETWVRTTSRLPFT